MKSKLLTINNYYSFYNNYSLYIIDSENDLDYNQFQKYSTEKNYINIINNKEDNEYKIIENILNYRKNNIKCAKEIKFFQILSLFIF